jgi:hypothetical protein
MDTSTAAAKTLHAVAIVLARIVTTATAAATYRHGFLSIPPPVHPVFDCSHFLSMPQPVDAVLSTPLNFYRHLSFSIDAVFYRRRFLSTPLNFYRHLSFSIDAVFYRCLYCRLRTSTAPFHQPLASALSTPITDCTHASTGQRTSNRATPRRISLRHNRAIYHGPRAQQVVLRSPAARCTSSTIRCK